MPSHSSSADNPRKTAPPLTQLGHIGRWRQSGGTVGIRLTSTVRPSCLSRTCGRQLLVVCAELASRLTNRGRFSGGEVGCALFDSVAVIGTYREYPPPNPHWLLPEDCPRRRVVTLETSPTASTNVYAGAPSPREHYLDALCARPNAGPPLAPENSRCRPSPMFKN
jgi:hypothetical protein